ncbi:type II toxin-antitoxin system RelE/ParE family toxin [Polaribacter sp. M15]
MKSLTNIYDYIFDDSPQNAIKVFETLLDLGDSLSDERFEYSKEPIINENKYRFIPKWNYKIIYERKIDKVVILDVFSTKQNPNELSNKF